MEQTANIKDRLEEEVKMFKTIGAPCILQRFVLRNGQVGKSQPFTGKRMEKKKCFMNATHFITNDKKTFYTEGYVWRAGLPVLIHHAWRSTAELEVIDPTIDRPEECQYIGVQIEHDVLHNELYRLGYYGILDTHRGINVRFMMSFDPGMQRIINGSES